MIQKSEVQKGRRLIKFFGVFGILMSLIWGGGFFVFTEGIRGDNGEIIVADGAAVVVLTGGRGRILAGYELLREGLAEEMFISGVHNDTNIENILVLDEFDDFENEDGDFWSCCVTLGYEAKNTRGNAVEVANWLENVDYDVVYLVTSDYHMRRAMLEFREELGDEVEIIPYPIEATALMAEGNKEVLRIYMREYNKYLLVWGYYFLRHIFE